MLHVQDPELVGARVSDFHALLAKIRVQLVQAEEHVKRLKAALESLEEAQQALTPITQELDFGLPQTAAPSEPQRVRGLLSPDEVALAARNVLLETGRPMKRGALVRALLQRQVPLAGKDKNKNLGTILWRHSHMFVGVPRLGYWVKGIRLPGIYEPDEDAILSPSETPQPS